MLLVQDGLLAPSALLYSVVSLSIYEARALPSLDGNMDMTYTFNEEDLASSVPGTPRSGLRTPPTSPLWSTGSAITTPGSSGEIFVEYYIHSS